MKPVERNITRFLRSRAGAFVFMGMAFIAILIASSVAQLPVVATGRGLVASVPSVLWSSYTLPTALLFIGVAMGLMTFINNTFNLLRSTSILYLGVFCILEAASPIISTQPCSGMFVAIVVLLSMALLYSVYQEPKRCTKRVFLTFFLLSLGSMAQYAFVAYLPVFLAGCAQMRCFNFRSFLAALIGVITPWWILWGFGLIDASSVSLPTYTSIFKQLDVSGLAQLAVVIAVTVIAGFTFTLINVVKIYSYNARSRSFTGLLVTVTIATLLIAMVDFANITAYLMTLNCCVAFQIALWFRINAENRGYIAVVSTIAVYFILYIWSLVI